MKRHAQKAHPNALKDQTSDEQPKLKQTSLTEVMSCPIYPQNSQKRIGLNKKLVRMIVKDLQPESIVEDHGFREFVAALDKKICAAIKGYNPEYASTCSFYRDERSGSG